MITYKSKKLIFDLKNYLVVHDQNLNIVVAKCVKDVKNGLYKLEFILLKILQKL